MNNIYKQPIDRLKRHMAEYQPQLKRAIAAIAILENTDPESDEFCNALAELHVCSTILEPYSEGMLEAIDQFTEDSVAEEK
ncbi:hypothetical protein APA_4798 [Pseudanabaena sp. lw0831]|uniref:hypothetical protein n=1 Tax=Pseudanabaena sp. lw0831 TaxID=1357935 RepID=UPI0019151D7E|nr:hypothetical protein [Pseudanabaena sp. lw0831]GBO56462.1 hypothetical protein APA_4798 [Pseudanabaena sp. lw0831]